MAPEEVLVHLQQQEEHRRSPARELALQLGVPPPLVGIPRLLHEVEGQVQDARPASAALAAVVHIHGHVGSQ
eukprot:12093186-Alexandrium_andersonii.AAC.1